MFKALHSTSLRTRRTSVVQEEEAAWIAFYRRVSDPAVAVEVIEHLEADAELKRTHPALYLSCKESVRKAKARVARRKRVRSLLRRMLRALDPDNGDRQRTMLARAQRLAVEAIPRANGRDGRVAPVHEPRFDVAPQGSAKAA